MRLRLCFRPLFFPAALCATTALLCSAPAERGAKLAVSVARRLPEAAATSTMRGPVAGYVVTPDGSALRAILGIPGAAVFSDPIALPEDVTRVHLAPGQAYALVELGESAPLAVMQLDTEGLGLPRPIPGTAPAPDLVAFSPRGAAAAVWFRGTTRLQVIIGLPEAPRIAREASLDGLPDLRSLAVDDGGEAVLLADGRNLLHQLVSEGSARMIHSADELSAVAFFPGRSDAVVYDRARGVVQLLTDAAGAAAGRVLTYRPGTVEGSVFLRASGDGHTVFLTGSAEKRILGIDLDTGMIDSLAVPVSPTLFERLKDSDTFLFDAQPGSPAWLYLRDAAEGRTVFVPAAAEPPPPEGAELGGNSPNGGRP